MKGGLAACLVAAAEAGRARPRGDVVVTAVVDEELSSVGTQMALKRVRPDAAIVAEPTGMRVCIAHKGFVAFEVETHGRAAHGSRPDLGVDAIAKMGHVLSGSTRSTGRCASGRRIRCSLRARCTQASSRADRSSRPTPTAACSRPSAGRCPARTSSRSSRSSRACSTASRRGDGDFKGTWRVVAARHPFEVSRTEEIVRLVAAYAGTGDPVGESYWTDAALISELLVPTVVFGPGGEGAHAAVEWVSIADVERCAAVFLSVAAEFCA